MHMVPSQVLLAARACMGIGEGVAMPAMNNLLSRRALSFGTICSGCTAFDMTWDAWHGMGCQALVIRW
jgi:hypothetical protein